MRWYFLIFLLSALPYFSQINPDLFQDQFPESGMYAINLKIVPHAGQTIYYSSKDDVNGGGMKMIQKELVISKTCSYLFKISSEGFDTIIHRSYHYDYLSKFPIISIAIDPEDLWNDTTGIYVRGKYAYWSDSTGHWENCNYQKKWEKAIYATYIDTSNTVGFSQKCGLKLFGESTRRQPDKSMKIIARTEYGDDDFSFAVFPQKAISAFKQIAIRTSGNDYLGSRFKDVLSAHLARNMGLDYMAYQPANLFVNGEYWGVYNLREKVNEHFIAENHGVDEDSVNIIMGKWVTQQGSSKRYLKMYHWFEDLDTMDDDAYAIAQTYLDVRNYINFRVFQIYINNKDSRGNIRYYNINGVQEPFKMILYDTDLGYGKYSFNFLEGCMSPTPTEWYNPVWSTMYLTKLMEHTQFKNDFVTQFAHWMNTTLHRDTILDAINQFEVLYSGELPTSSTGRPSHLKNVVFPTEKWQDEVNSLRAYAKLRPKVMWDHLKEVLQLSDTYFLKFHADSLTQGAVKINDNYPLPLSFEGRYFRNIPLKIEVVADSGYRFLSWSNGDTNRIVYIQEFQDTILLTPTFETTLPSELTVDQVKGDEVPSSESLSLFDQWIKHHEALLLWIALGFVALGVLLLLYYLLRG